MDKKPLIVVSLCAVVLLVLGSLSNVVGYQSLKSTVNDSPLFQTRTQRATNQQQNILTSQYLGMGKETLLQFSIRDNRSEQLKKVIGVIDKIDDTTFTRFTEVCIQKARQDDTLRDLNRSQIVQALLLLKTNPDAIINSYVNRSYQELPKTAWSYCSYTVWGVRIPLCLPGLIFWSVIILLSVINLVIYTLLKIVFTTADY